ncbi:MAG: 50S ribosomal protein L16 [Candidatus Yonathbacteria bacterium RIFCSPHIGHO2_01_FULL_44_41]|uniref:50S ribosomal protein L16 n=1 Tax=Candidatus Yonathbacteria bacterium RIFCSPHIGHO2_02_FULL_44_14 TaxID=1802724 RepID=A0A1G2S6A6_9BACT|nr:MAG: 50S ribosomal protein L16 [Candidatus Yonathbacteria bacterium RIFCSPHIGHO2_01_FULL_44_41]OHA80586.1 MAG: 50S ribosomal protein L16 [Candidatus Yonathbacteria bacterium RIFCSPHIGHO2_02_FULL_44_14]OHA82122.1 MAG: 50S ribosomal protein L16 [Candidatus Yonathbacteria bacterium RIFCSPLOWO2_01_FULL_43_20]
MLFPKKVKYRKWQNARKSEAKLAAPETRGITLAFGSFGLKAETQARVKSNQIEASRKAIVRTITKVGKMWIRIFPDRPWTQKGAQVGMGKGKGELQGYVFEVRPGRMLFEVDGVDEATAVKALKKAGAKLPLKTRIVRRVETA